MARQGNLALIVGGIVAVSLGLGIGYWVARKMALENLSQVATCCAVGGKRQLPGPRQSHVEGRTRTDGHIVQYMLDSYHGVGNVGM